MDLPDERRHLTVMFSDLVGSTELASTLDPEDLHEVIDAYQRKVASVVELHSGVIAQFQGDGVVAYFGYPAAMESAGLDAVTAGLDLVSAVGRLARELPAEFDLKELAARVGIHTGEVVVASTNVGVARKFGDVFGEVPNLAARLQAAGAPGEVIVSDVTASLVTGYFVMEAIGALTLKGISREVQVYRVQRRSSARRRLETGPLTGYVDRPRESAWLHEQWDSVQAGPARAVLVSGEPGIGKSRLMQEFAGLLSSAGTPIAPMYCERRDALSPLRPFGPLMGEVPLAPDQAAHWLMERAAGGPLLLLVEDAHWADPSTIEAIDQVVHSDQPVLGVLTARPEFSEDPLMRTARRLDLDRLRPEDALAVVSGVPGGEQLSEEVRQALVDRADGVPLYLEELTRAVMEGTADPAGAGIPPTLSEVIAARLDRLGEAKRIAQLAAIIGRSFDRPILQAVSGLDGPALDAQLQYLVDQAVMEVPTTADGQWWFRHALIHEAAYRSVLRTDRRRAHSAVADQLVLAQIDESHPEAVAYHLGAAGRAPEAVETWRQAARSARRNARFREAAGHERELLDLVPHLPEDARETVEMEACSRLTLCLTAVDQNSPEAMEEGLKVQQLARRTGDRKSLLRSLLVLLPWWQANADYGAIAVALPEAQELAVALEDAWSEQTLAQFAGAFRIWQGRVPEGIELLETSFETIGLPLAASMAGMPHAALPVAEIVVSSTRIAAALGYWLRGRVTDANRVREDVVRFAADRAVPQAQAVTAATAAVMAQLDGDRDLVIALTTETIDMADDVANRQWRQWGAALRWWAGVDMEEPEVPGPLLRPYFLMLLANHETMPAGRALGMLGEALDTVRRTGEEFCLPEILRVRAEVMARAGDPLAARANLETAVTSARDFGMRMLVLRSLTDLVRLEVGIPAHRTELAAQVDELSGQDATLSMVRAKEALGES